VNVYLVLPTLIARLTFLQTTEVAYMFCCAVIMALAYELTVSA